MFAYVKAVFTHCSVSMAVQAVILLPFVFLKIEKAPLVLLKLQDLKIDSLRNFPTKTKISFPPSLLFCGREHHFSWHA